MKEKNLFCLIICMLVLSCSVLAESALNSGTSATDTEHNSNISLLFPHSGDFIVSNSDHGNQELQIRTLHQEPCIYPTWTIDLSNYIKINSFKRNSQYFSDFFSLRETIKSRRDSILFSGVLLI